MNKYYFDEKFLNLRTFISSTFCRLFENRNSASTLGGRGRKGRRFCQLQQLMVDVVEEPAASTLPRVFLVILADFSTFQKKN